jgi:hypothetical protein
MTDTLNRIYDFVCAYVAERKTGPLVMEIAAGCRISSETAGEYVRRLIEQKRLQRTWRQRSIVPAETLEDALRLSKWRKSERRRAQRRPAIRM